MNKEARARWRDFEDSKSLARIYKKNKKQGDRFMDFVNEQYRNRIVPGNIAHMNNVGGLPKDVYSAAGKVLSKNKGTDDYIRKGISNYGRPAQLPTVISRKAAQKATQSATQNAAQKATQSATQNAAQKATQNAAQKATQSATQNAAQKATNVATEAAKKGGKLGRSIAALAGLAMIGGTAYGAHKYRQNRARQQEQEEKVASIILEDLADIKSRYEAYEKEADENMMEEMSKEARARWRDFESAQALRAMRSRNPQQADRLKNFMLDQHNNRIFPGMMKRYRENKPVQNTAQNVAQNATQNAAQKAAQSATQNAAQGAASKATQNAAQGAASKATNVATEAAKKGGKLGKGIAALAGGAALIGGTAYGVHKYRQNKMRRQQEEQKTAFEVLDDYVYEKEAASVGGVFKNMTNSKAFKRVAPILNDAWRGAAAGAMTGAAGGALSEYKDKEDNKVHRLKNALHGMKNGAIMGGVGGAAYGTWKDKDHAIGKYNSKGYKKRASEDLDGLYKQALNATMVGGAIGGYDSLKGIGRQFMKGFKGNEGNFIKNVGAGIKNVGLKGIEKGIGKTVAGAAIGAGIDGISSALKRQDPNNPYQ